MSEGVSIDEVWSSPSLLGNSIPQTPNRSSRYMRPLNQPMGGNLPVTSESPSETLMDYYSSQSSNEPEYFYQQQQIQDMPPPDQNTGHFAVHHEMNDLKSTIYQLKSRLNHMRALLAQHQQQQQKHSKSAHEFKPTIWVYLLIFVLLLIILGLVLYQVNQHKHMFHLLLHRLGSMNLNPASSSLGLGMFPPPPPSHPPSQFQSFP